MSRFSGRIWLQDETLSRQLFIKLSLLSCLSCLIWFAYLRLFVFNTSVLSINEMWRVVVSYGLICVIQLIFTFEIASSLVAPFEKIASSMSKIKNKVWKERIYQVNRKDEIGQIINSLSDIQAVVNEINEDEELFYQSVSHGLQTPLMVIQNCCSAYEDGISNGEQAITIIKRESALLEEGIKKLLYVNSFDHILGKNSQFVSIDLAALLNQCVMRFALRMSLEHLRFNFEVPENSIIIGDRDSLETMFNNIIENAIRYVQHCISISCVENEDSYTVQIENDGNPIDRQTMDSLFVRFFKGPKGHFGIGLYIAKKICSFHDGDVWAENMQNGVRFCVCLKKKPSKNSENEGPTSVVPLS